MTQWKILYTTDGVSNREYVTEDKTTFFKEWDDPKWGTQSHTILAAYRDDQLIWRPSTRRRSHEIDNKIDEVESYR